MAKALRNKKWKWKFPYKIHKIWRPRLYINILKFIILSNSDILLSVKGFTSWIIKKNIITIAKIGCNQNEVSILF